MNLIEVFDFPFKLIQEDIDHNNDCMTLVYCTKGNRRSNDERRNIYYF